MYRTELDGLRAVAVTAVLLNHVSSALLPGGYLGVDCFFVLSGYVVARSWEKRGDNKRQEFYKRRLRRLQPALILMLVITGVLSWWSQLLNTNNFETGLTALLESAIIHYLRIV